GSNRPVNRGGTLTVGDGNASIGIKLIGDLSSFVTADDMHGGTVVTASATPTGGAGNDLLGATPQAEMMSGNGGSNTFLFHEGNADGDTVTDFVSGADHLEFVGYGAGSVTQVDATHWEVDSADRLTHETITFANAVTLHASDWHFA